MSEFMKKKEIFRGTATALITPFINGEIDYPALAGLIDMQIAAGIDALVIGGTTAEAATLSDKEKYALFDFSAERINKRTKLIFGTGTNDTRAAVRHSRFAEGVGCDGLLVVTPYYNKGTESGIEKHYLSIAESVDLPTLLYNVPSRTGVNLGINLLSRLKEHENIVGIKEAGDSTDRLVRLAVFGDELALYSGNDSQIFPTLALGGLGVISVVSNILPGRARELTDAYFAGDSALARQIQFELLPLISALFLETNPAPVKYAMSRLGLCSGELRLPLAEVRESTKTIIDGLI